ncbi:IclR family transcriptional regulator [Herbihabitans rhizosphaerae]|uniref:Glycerol operon regulatory protein n=1 Tax=Herbihabitans rhizosphaerae TaxID=1872711 RepID=A0A4Q7KIM8_9PSEU|nr:IclR family transcriptional regulator [Herbihabitans rhizosphaerae]RZS32758.1 IclR family transcriptional regulator [Herbihabitans rhizosphaerae]
MGGSSDVPALRRGLAVLRVLADRAEPVTAAWLARELALPRSTAYHLLAELTDAGFVTHLPDQRRYALGLAAFELGAAYLRNEPLEHIARPLLRQFADRHRHTVHLGVLHGRETLYLVREQPTSAHTLVTDVGVRLPAHLTASGRAMLAHLPAAQVRALFPNRDAFVDRTGRGPKHLPALRGLLTDERRRGWAIEDGHVTTGFASVAVPVLDGHDRPVAAISATFRHHCPGDTECGTPPPDLVPAVLRLAVQITARAVRRLS